MSDWEKTEGQQGLEQATATEQHFWTDADGAHISSTGDHDTSGFHQLLTSVKNVFMHGTTELMTISADLIELGKNSTSAVIKFCAGTGEIGVIDSMLTLFADKVGVKGNSQAVLASNGDVTAGASKENTTYTGLAQMAEHAPSSDTDYSYSLMQARCTKNSDSSTVSESYINLTAKPDGTAPATVKASEIAMNSSAQTNKYIRVKTDSSIEVDCPHVESQSIHIGSYNTSTGQPVDAGITYIPIYGEAQTPACYLNVQQIQTPSNLIPIEDFESAIVPATATGSANFPADWTIGTFELLKRGKEVCCRIDATYKEDITLDYDLFTIPSGFRPASEATAPGAWATSNVYPAFVKFESSGVVHVLSTGSSRRLTCIAKWMTA